MKLHHRASFLGRIRCLPVIAIILLPLFSSCAPPVQHYAKVDNLLAQGLYSEADSVIEKEGKQYGERNEILYNLDRAMTLHLSGRYAESNNYLDKSERKMEELFTKSITAETGAMFTNDNILPYEGEDFEKVMLNVISALNYVYLHEWDDALVEARKIDHKLNLFNDKYEKKNIYKEDAFARYLTGILYEAKGEDNDAFIAYRKAYETYTDYQKDYKTPLPDSLPADLLRTTDALQLSEEKEFYKEKFPDTKWTSQKESARQGEVIFVSLDGRAPIKTDFFIDAPIPDGRGGIYPLRIALPKFVLQPSRLEHIEIQLISTDGVAATQGMFLAEDIAAIAVKNLEDRIARITARAIARATAKYLASYELKKKAGNDPLSKFLVDIGTDVYSIASEQADKRSWRTLPAKIRMGRLTVNPGSYTLKVEYYASGNRLIDHKDYPVVIRAGEKKFLSNRFVD